MDKVNYRADDQCSFKKSKKKDIIKKSRKLNIYVPGRLTDRPILIRFMK